jgi:hypothetical protein
VALAYATLAGLPPQVGVYGYILGGLGYALLGSSRHLAIGPTSAISLMVAASVGTMAGGDAARYAEIASLARFAIAILCVIAWALRLSVLVKLISDSILVGFKAFAERVVRQFGEMHDRIESYKVSSSDLPHVLRVRQRSRVVVVIEPAITVKTTINPDSVETVFQEPRSEHGANIPVDAGNQYPHSRHVYLVKNGSRGDQKIYAACLPIMLDLAEIIRPG